MDDTPTSAGSPSVATRIREKLEQAFAPIWLDVIDESHKHAGHAHMVMNSGPAGPPRETHFRLKVVSDSFNGKSRIERHRMINGLLSAELADGVHALAIEAKAPGE